MKALRFLPLFFLLAVAACSGSTKETHVDFPENFSSLPDTAKVSFMIETVGPDSVARFICDASLGKVAAGKIESLPVAAAYAYEHYADSCLIVFSRVFDNYSAELPLAEKMKIYFMAGESDPQKLGYELGLEYVDHIRTAQLSPAQVKEEIASFKTACAEDSMTFVRFVKGFQTALKADRGKDLPENVYQEFINY